MSTSTETDRVEIWECNIDGRVSMDVPGFRPGVSQRLTAAGKGQRIRIRPGDRVIVEEGIREVQKNPFVNGMLSQVGGPSREPNPDRPEEAELGNQQLSDDDLAVFFSLSPEEFESQLAELSQANVFRLRTLVIDKGGTVRQQQIITDYVEEKWPVTSGDTKSYREMRQEPER